MKIVGKPLQINLPFKVNKGCFKFLISHKHIFPLEQEANKFPPLEN